MSQGPRTNQVHQPRNNVPRTPQPPFPIASKPHAQSCVFIQKNGFFSPLSQWVFPSGGPGAGQRCAFSACFFKKCSTLFPPAAASAGQGEVVKLY